MRLKRRFKHMIESIKAESGLIDDCTHMVYLNEGYTHEVFGDSYPVKNSKELKDFMEEVIPTDEKVIDIACLTQPVDFYNISKLGDVTLTYYVESIVRTLQTTGEELLNIFFNDPKIDEYNMISLNDILKIEGSDKTYIIHGYDISWWRNNLKRLDNGLRKLEKKEEVKRSEKTKQVYLQSLKEEEYKLHQAIYEIEQLSDEEFIDLEISENLNRDEFLEKLNREYDSLLSEIEKEEEGLNESKRKD